MKVKTQELFNFYSHFAGAVAAVVGTVYLAMAPVIRPPAWSPR